MERRSIALAAIVTAAVTLASGCASNTGRHAAAAPASAANPVGATATTSPSSTPSAPDPTPATPTPATSPAATATTAAAPAPAFDASVPTISDGTSTVMVGGKAVTFPSTVTDAVWSPNGTALAYVDGDGNIAIAHPDGTHVQVLTKGSGVKRAHPAWDTDQIAFAELKNGAWVIREVPLPFAGDYPQGHAGNETDWGWSFGSYQDNKSIYTTSSAPGVMQQTPNSGREYGYGGLEYVAQVKKDGKDEVFVFDRNMRGHTGDLSFAGTDPALSPDGTQVVFVGANGQLEVAGTEYLSATAKPAAAHQITFGADHPSHPAWSPDGSRIAFRTSHDVESVGSAVKAGATSNAARQEWAKPGVPNYPTVGSLKVQTVDGADAVAASIALSQARFPTATSVTEFNGPTPAEPNGAVLVASDSDAAAAAAAYSDPYDAQPLLFTTPGSLDARTAAELKRVFGPCLAAKSNQCGWGNGAEITLVGTAKEFPASVVAKLIGMGFKVKQVTAADPYDLTLVNASADAPAIYVVDPADHAAALAAVHTARDMGGVVILSQGRTLTPAARAFLQAVKFGATQDRGPVTVTAVGPNAAAALGASWSGKPSFQFTALTGDAPAAQVGLMKLPGWSVPSQVALVTASGNRAMFALPGVVIPADAGSRDVAALVARDGSVVRGFWSVGAPGAGVVSGFEGLLGYPVGLGVVAAGVARF